MEGVDKRVTNRLQSDDEPYRRLWASVLYQAIADANRKGIYRAALHWIYSPHTEAGSLRWICDMLDYDYDEVQKLCMTRQGRSQILGRGRARSNPTVAAFD